MLPFRWLATSPSMRPWSLRKHLIDIYQVQGMKTSSGITIIRRYRPDLDAQVAAIEAILASPVRHPDEPTPPAEAAKADNLATAPSRPSPDSLPVGARQ